jgi:predicted RNase H-like HicB family nuclease
MDLTLLVKPLESGHYVASVLELPAYRVEAESRELAIDLLKDTLLNQVKDAEISSLKLPIAVSPSAENPWKDLFGIFRDDIYFKEVVELIEAEKEALGDAEIDPAYYMPLDS